MSSVLGHSILACTTAGTGTQAAAGGGGLGFSIPGLGLGGLVASATGLVLMGLLVAALLTLALRPTRPHPVAVQVGGTVSPDGHYWWDGAAWRPVR